MQLSHISSFEKEIVWKTHIANADLNVGVDNCEVQFKVHVHVVKLVEAYNCVCSSMKKIWLQLSHTYKFIWKRKKNKNYMIMLDYLCIVVHNF